MGSYCCTATEALSPNPRRMKRLHEDGHDTKESCEGAR